MSNYYIQGSGGWPFGLDALSISGQLFPSQTDSNLLIGYFGFPTNSIEKGYFFRIWEGLNTSLNIWYGAGPNNIAVLRSSFIGSWGVAPNSQVTAKITFNKNTKAYSIAGTPSAESVNFISSNSSIIGSTVSSQNSASIGVYYNGWHWEKDFTFNTTSTINYKIVLGGGSQYGDNNLDGVATLGENFIPLNVVAGNTYRFRAKPFTADLSGPLPTLEYEVVCLTCPVEKQNQFISTPFDIYNKLTTSPPFSLQATTNSNLPLFYSTSSPLFTLNTDGVVNLFGSSGSGVVSIFQPGDEQWFPASKNVTINIEETSDSCINRCLNTGLLYFTDDTFINLYNVTKSGLFLSEDIESLVLSNESWQDYYTGFTGYGLNEFNNTNAGIILKINDSTKINNQNKFRINYGVNESKNIVGNYHKQLISIRPQKPKNVGYLGYFSNDNAWATYDVSTGMITGSLTPNNVFSYAIEVVASGVLTGNNFYYTGNIDISTETGLAYILNSQKNPILYTENFNVLSTISFNEIQDFCKITECKDPKEPDPLELCYTGEFSNEKEFQLFLSGFAKIANTVVVNRPKTDNLLIVSNSGEEIKYSNTIYSGYILYNSWQSGDYIQWDLYNFNFPDLYQSFHLGNYPPYPSTGFRIYYPEDFNSLDSLTDRLNEKIDLLKTYPVWYPYECLKDTESGIFLTGELMTFYKNTGTTGSLPISHFNNRIDFISLRSFPQLQDNGYLSYKISIFSPKKIQKDLFSGWSYLIPTNIQLEGYNKNTQNWEILDIKSNLSGDFAEANRIKKSIGTAPGVGKKDDEKNEELAPLPEEGELPLGPSSCKTVIFSDIQRNINFNENPLCPPKIIFRDIIVTAPKEECKQKTVDANGNIIQKKSNAELCEDLDSGGGPAGGGGDGGEDEEKDSIGDYYIIRTGWNFTIDNLNNQIGGLNNNIGTQGFDINKIYDKYKVSLSNFVSIPEENLFQKDSFLIKNVNLYTLDKSGFGIHKGPSLCSIGADYIIDVSGLFPVEISGIWTYNITPEESGIYRFFKTPFARKIEENERLVKFNKVSGKIISPSGTGFLSTSGYGVGILYYEDSSRYFYNPSTESVYFTETLTDLATGSGVLSGEKIAIKESVINQELLFGGRLNNNENLLYHEIVSNGNLVSEIEDVEYVKYDILGFYPITGRVSGTTISGRLNINETVVLTGSPVGDIFAYDPVPTGFTFSKVLFNINYNVLNNFNFLSLNDNTIIYHEDSSSYPPPTYFNSNETLISIINNSLDAFLCTGEIIGSNIQLYSTLKGESGNINLTSNSTGLQIIEYVSGFNIYPRLYKIVTKRTKNCIDDDPIFVNLPGNCTFSFSREITDPLMTGNLGDNILATGFYYSSLGSGNIIGNVKTFTGVRSFFDVWDIATGSLTRNYLSFLQNNFISGNSFYKESLFDSSPRNVRLRAFYQNYLNTSTEEEQDVADLIIKDLNNPTLSESGVIFRLNGIK
jgi:hypothetical protein